MKQYDVTGMSCAACSARVEKAVGKVKGVTSCSVSLLTNSMGVEGTASPQDIISAVEKAGYGARLKGAKTENTDTDGGSLRDTETPGLRKRLIASLVFLVILMYFSMGHMMWGFPLPSWFDGNHVAMGLVQLLLSANYNGYKRQILYKRLQGIYQPLAEYGYACGARLRCVICMERICPVYDDRCTAAPKCRCRYDVYGRVLF